MYYGGRNMIGYIKKEDAREVANMQKTMLAIILGGLAFTFGLMEIFIAPRLLDFGITLSNSMMVLSIILSLSVIFVLTHQYNFTKIESVSKKYSKGEMIKIGLLWDYKYEYFGMSVLVASMAYLVYTVILPIYNLSSSM